MPIIGNRHGGAAGLSDDIYDLKTTARMRKQLILDGCMIYICVREVRGMEEELPILN